MKDKAKALAEALLTELEQDYSGRNAFGNACPKGSLADCSKGYAERMKLKAALRDALSEQES